MYYLIITKLISITPPPNMLDTNVIVDKKCQSFATSRKHNHSVTMTSPQVSLECDPLKCQQNNTTNINITNSLRMERTMYVFKLT